jgi:nitrate reductase NapE component
MLTAQAVQKYDGHPKKVVERLIFIYLYVVMWMYISILFCPLFRFCVFLFGSGLYKAREEASS